MKAPNRQPYPIYSGAEPYVFISYAHADADRVLPVIGELNAERLRLWYDAGIRAGTAWPEVVASHLLHAGAVVFFLSGVTYVWLSIVERIARSFSRTSACVFP